MKTKRTFRSRRRGATLVEIVVASGMTTLVLFGAILAFLSGMTNWIRGQGRMDAESQSQRAVRALSQELRQAMSVTVDVNGLGLTYRMPAVDVNGDYVVPVVWDNVVRRAEYNNGTVRVMTGGIEHIVSRNVILTDPLSNGGSAAYNIFTAGGGAITRQLTIMVVTRTNSARNETVTGRIRETVYLRNIPSLTQ